MATHVKISLSSLDSRFMLTCSQVWMLTTQFKSVDDITKEFAFFCLKKYAFWICRVTSTRWPSGRPQHLSLQKRSVTHGQKWLRKNPGVHMRNLSDMVEQNKLENNWTGGGRTVSLSLHHLIPQASSAQHREGTSQVERVPLTGRGMVWSFFSYLGHCTKVLLQLHLIQRPVKRREAGRQGRKAGAIGVHHAARATAVHSDLLCKAPQVPWTPCRFHKLLPHGGFKWLKFPKIHRL